LKISERERADLSLLTARQLELWKPILSLAMFFDSTNPAGVPVLPLMIKMAAEHSVQTQTDNTIESPDAMLAQVLLRMVEEKGWSDGYVPVAVVTKAMRAEYNDEKRWLNNEWVGRMVRRFGVGRGTGGKRRVGGGIEYMITRRDVQVLAKRLGVDVDRESNPTRVLTYGASQVTLEDDGYVSAWLHL
jgi:hypothetical protein